MRIIGFNLDRINAQKNENIAGQINISTEFSIKKIEKESSELFKDQTLIKSEFSLIFNYRDKSSNSEKESVNLASVSFEGTVVLTCSEEESKELLKSWKKKEISEHFKVSLLNAVMKKCSSKALLLQDELNIPSHLPIPQVAVSNKK